MGEDVVEGVAQGVRDEQADQSLALYSQEAILERMLAAMKEILGFGFGCELRGRPLRGGVEYRLRITTNGPHERPVRTLQAIADMHRLAFHVASEEGDTLELVLYPRA